MAVNPTLALRQPLRLVGQAARRPRLARIATPSNSAPSGLTSPTTVRSPRTSSASPRYLSTTPPNKAGARSAVGTAVLVSVVGIAAYVLGSIYPSAVLSIIYPRPGPPRLRDDSPEAQAHAEAVEKALHALPIVKQLKSQSVASGAAADLPACKEGTLDPTQQKVIPADGKIAGANIALSGPGLEGGEADRHHYVMTRPYLRYDAVKAQHSLTAGSLRGPGMIAIPPVVFAKTAVGAKETGGSEGDSVILVHLGRSLCGHDGIIHGGMLATICDEALARTAMYNLPGHIGVTAKLEINYRKPTRADQFIVVKTQLVEAKGRKAQVTAQVENLEGTLLLDSKALFIEPKYAKYFLDAETMKRHLEG
ncbi:uncharacterized protein PFL1_04848 [Pseudozyma flocculosa PF-1]|uniref:Thioesterase domain-containing protein n=1 Tax=Pseudozyma flocculosa PF-1 TaxID=1277687 RepID=A0A061H6S1_9BASI|nr:uncharacterized protein PFL1_04848 [Pseudozyma flocculosa PF-1]EPQ27710.1 hypothetical protein PFL1_04848 [Pseudozyma flocculosa PF-1]